MAETAVKAKVEEGLFSKRRLKVITDPFNESNPVTVQVLGICSSLAVTVQMKPTFVMALSVTVVTAFSNLVISMLRNLIPPRIRIIAMLGVVATLVILVDQLLRAYMYDVSKLVGVYVGLIITNCIVMGRLEAYAMGNKPYDSFLDGMGNGFGYSWVILAVAFVRELFGSGSLFGWKVFAAMGIPNFPLNGLMVTPVGAFVILGIIIWIQRAKSGYTESH